MRQSNSEVDLIGRMQAGDTAAVGELASMYGPRIQQLAFRYVKNWEDADELPNIPLELESVCLKGASLSLRERKNLSNPPSG